VWIIKKMGGSRGRDGGRERGREEVGRGRGGGGGEGKISDDQISVPTSHIYDLMMGCLLTSTWLPHHTLVYTTVPFYQ
jgi:hypothetical protein